MRGWEILHFRTGADDPRASKSLAETRPNSKDLFAMSDSSHFDDSSDAIRDIAEVPAVEVITTTAVHLMSAAAVKCGLADDPDLELDLDEARKLITALAGLVTASAPFLGDQHARSLRDGLRSLQLAFREASAVPDAVGEGPGEKYTGPVN
jgi:hypothetical protein